MEKSASSSLAKLKKLLTILLVITLLISCSPKLKDPAELLIGQWEYVETKNGYDAFQYDIEFVSDGTFLIPEASMLMVNTFEYGLLEGNRLRLTALGMSEIVGYELDGDQLKLIFEDGYNLYARAGSNIPTVQIENDSEENQQSLDLPKEPDFISNLITKISDEHPVITNENANKVVDLRRISPASKNSINSIAISADSKILAVKREYENITLYNLTDLVEIGELPNTDKAENLAFSSEDRLLAFSDNSVHVLDLESGKIIFTLSGHDDHIEDIAFSPDGKILASSSSDKTVRLWDLSNGNSLFVLIHANDVSDIAFSNDGTILVTSSTGGNIYFWNVKSGKIINLTKESYGVQTDDIVTVLPGDDILVVGFSLVDIKRGEEKGSLWSYAPGRLMLSTDVSPNGDLLAAGLYEYISLTDLVHSKLGYEIERIKLPDTVDLEQPFDILGKTATFEEFRNGVELDDGRLITWYGNKRSRTAILSVPSNVVGFRLEGLSSPTYQIAFSRDGRYLVSVCQDQTIIEWGIP